MAVANKQFQRALRRHHRARMIARAARSFVVSSWPDRAAQQRAAVRLHDHLQVCSCWMCGNPRRHAKGQDRLPLADRKAAQSQRTEN